MSVKSILVQLDDSDACDIRLEAAAGLSERFGARLSGICPQQPPRHHLPPTRLEPAESSVDDKQYRRHQETVRRHIQQKLADNEHAQCRDMQWHMETGNRHRILAEDGRCHDLILVSRALNDTGPLAGLSELAADIAVQAGRPVLMLPQPNGDGREPAQPWRRILIAWNASREAARALHDALPFLQSADHADIFTGPHDPQSDHRGDIRRYLQQHNIDADRVPADTGDDDTGETLLRRVEQDHYDLIVMGAYSHSRLRELFLGSTTRQVLKKAPVPVLLSH